MASLVLELLVKVGVLDDRQHDAVMSRAKGGTGGDLVRALNEMGYATESTVARVLSVELALPRVDLAITPPEHEALGLLDMKTCIERFVLPIALRENGELLWLAMGDPTDSETMALIRRKTDKRVRPVVAGPSEIVREARRLYVMPESPGSLSGTNALPGATQPSGGLEIEAPPDTNEAFEVVGVGDDLAAPIERIAAQLGVPVPDILARRKLPPDEGVEIDLDAGGDSTMHDARPVGVPSRWPNDATVQDLKPVSPSPLGIGPRPSPRAPPQTVKPVVKGRPPGTKGPPPPPLSLEPESASDESEAEIEEVLESREEDPLAARPSAKWPYVDDLAAEDVLNIEALRTSMEKGALVLRALAELCVEKGVFTREEMRKKSR